MQSHLKRTSLLVLAVTLHNIPEGMAVGLSFALAAQHGDDPALYAAAMALAIGIGIQNFPEAHLGEHSNSGTLGVMAGFLVMMILDVALG